MGRNLKNAAIALLAPLPSVLFYLSFLRHFHDHNLTSATTSTSHDDSFFHDLLWTDWCYRHPFLLANILFFLNINLLFWLISFIQSSHWMIDVYWTMIPVLLVHYYASHPAAHFNLWRSRVVIFLTWVWSIRLSHNYFRRERWQWGVRQRYGKNWWWVSFFAVYLSQQVFLIGVSLPLFAVHSIDESWNIWDFVGVIVCLSGILVAYYADTQLYNFVSRNNKLKELGMPMVPNLDEGLWHYSRHPNYFGEQLWWWGLVIFGWNLGCGWTFVGALINSMCLAYVTVLVENRMLKQDYRAGAYRLYQKSTSVWIPWFKSSQEGEKDKNT